MIAVAGLALAWAALLGGAVLTIPARARVRARARRVRPRRRAPARPARRRRTRLGRIRSDDSRVLPLLVELLGVASRAGEPPPRALAAVAPWVPTPARRWIDAVEEAGRRGASFGEALGAATARHAAFAPLSELLQAVTPIGAPLAPSLDRLAADLRAEQRRAAETRARTLPVRLLFPLVFLVLPAFVLLTVAPALLAGFGAR